MMFTNIPMSQVDSFLLEGSYGTSVNDSMQGRLREAQYVQQEDVFGNLQMLGTASNVGSRTTYFNKIVFDVKTPQVQTCDFTFIQGSTVSLPGGGTTSTGLFPGQSGTFLNFTGVPFGPLEVRRYTNWDETAPAGASSTLNALQKTDAKVAAIFAALEADRSLLWQLVSGSETPDRRLVHRVRNRIEARLQELEERMASAKDSARVPFADRLVLPVRRARDSRN